MKFTCTQENLHQGLVIASHINTKNINLPILNNILLKVENNILKLVATNLEIAIITKIRGKADSEGEYTVPSKLLSDYISLLPKENVVILKEDDFLHISSANHKTKIKGMSSDDYPIVPQINKKHSFYLDSGILKEALGQVSFAVLPNEARPEISGIYMNFNQENGKMALAATDSFRLAEKRIGLDPKSSKEAASIILPLRTAWELANILSTMTGEENLVEISLDEGQVYFKYNNTEMTSRLVEGIFPDYAQIIPKEHSTRAILPIREFLTATRSASLFSRSGLNDVKINITPGEGVDVYSTDNQTGEEMSKIVAEINGITNKIVLNHKYLVDGLSNIGGEDVVMDIIDESSPCVMRPVGDNSYLYIVMPIKQ